jgi:hypothetical protein
MSSLLRLLRDLTFSSFQLCVNYLVSELFVDCGAEIELALELEGNT